MIEETAMGHPRPVFAVSSYTALRHYGGLRAVSSIPGTAFTSAAFVMAGVARRWCRSPETPHGAAIAITSLGSINGAFSVYKKCSIFSRLIPLLIDSGKKSGSPYRCFFVAYSFLRLAAMFGPTSHYTNSSLLDFDVVFAIEIGR